MTGTLSSPEKFRICCVIEGEDIVFPGDVSVQADVADLKEVIYTRRARHTLQNVAIDNLELWKPRGINTIVAKPADTLLERIESMGASLSEFADKLDPMDRLSDVFPTQPSMKHVQIVVKVSGKRKRENVNHDDVGAIIGRWQSKRLKSQLPSIDGLKEFVNQPLLDNEKIPLSANRFESLINTTVIGADWCSRSDVEALFRPEDGHSISALDWLFFTVSKAPPHSGTESLFHVFWDLNVRQILELLIPHGRSTRDSSCHTATRALRPDYAFILHKLCAFRGEERSPESNDNPKVELSKKLAWAYDPAPYVLGYYAIGARFTLVAITPPPGHGDRPVVYDIAYADLRLRKDRIKNICRLINIAGLLENLANLVRPLETEFEVLQRDHSTVEVAGHCVIKTYTGPDKTQRVERLKNTYDFLANKNVPHIDSLFRHHDTTVVLRPRGISRQPETEDELLAALICVLEMLEVLHQEPPVFHRDIRWPNVVRRLDDPCQWFVIDWEEASTPPTQAQSHFNHATHSPHVFSDGHGAEVDIWGVGDLITQCDSLDISEKLRSLGKRMQSATPPSVQEALVEVKSFRASH